MTLSLRTRSRLQGGPRQEKRRKKKNPEAIKEKVEIELF